MLVYATTQFKNPDKVTQQEQLSATPYNNITQQKIYKQRTLYERSKRQRPKISILATKLTNKQTTRNFDYRCVTALICLKCSIK